MRGIYNTLPFNKLPRRKIVGIIALVIFWMNALPPSLSIGDKLRTRQILTGLTIDHAKHCLLQFDEYSQIHKAHNNTMQEQTNRAISLWTTGNAQGAYFLMSLTTGRRLNRQIFTPLPLPQDVINGVHRLHPNHP